MKTRNVCRVVGETSVEIHSRSPLRNPILHDLAASGLPRAVAAAMSRAFVALHGGTTIESQRAAIAQFKKFAASVAHANVPKKALAADCLKTFDDLQIKQGFSTKTVGSAHNTIARALRWCDRNVPGIVPKGVDISPVSFSAQAKKERTSKKTLDSESVKKILAACYADIEESNERILHERQLPLSTFSGDYGDLLIRLLSIGDGEIATTKQLLSSRGSVAMREATWRYGGLRSIAGRYYLCIDDVFPYYLAILIQTSGNPQSVLEMKRNCIVAMPLRPSLERLVWDKGRAHREQAPEFPSNKTWSAPNIVRKLLAMNEELLRHVHPIDKDKLFLARNFGESFASCPSWQSIHNSLKKFQLRHNLPKFELRIFRTTGAVLHNQAARSVVAASKRLQHKRLATARSYTDPGDLQEFHDDVIRTFQGLMVTEAEKQVSSRSVHRQSTEISEPAVETVFGFGCKSPRAGIAPGSRAGETCLNFQQCASCPGAIVVVDDPACVARLLQAKQALLDSSAQSIREGWSHRFEALYGPTLKILNEQILPSVSQATVARANALALPPLPYLE